MSYCDEVPHATADTVWMREEDTDRWYPITNCEGRWRLWTHVYRTERPAKWIGGTWGWRDYKKTIELRSENTQLSKPVES